MSKCLTRRCLPVLAALAVLLCTGCATITGTATGAFTGAVDAPAETYRHNAAAFHEYPICYGLDVLVMGPVGLVTGPVFGFVKGLSLDVQWVTNHIDYGPVFGSYGTASIWRPWTLQWHSRFNPPVYPAKYDRPPE